MASRAQLKADADLVVIFTGLAAMVTALVVGLKPVYIVAGRLSESTFELVVFCVFVALTMFAPVFSSVIAPRRGLLAAGLAAGMGCVLMGGPVWIYGMYMTSFPSWALGLLLAGVSLGAGLLVARYLQPRMLALEVEKE